MDSSDNLQNSIIEKILTIRNKDFLKALNQLISSSQSTNIYELDEDQKNILNMAREDVENGRTIDNETIKSKYQQWLEKQN